MKRKSSFLIIAGIMFLLTSCEKGEDSVFFSPREGIVKSKTVYANSQAEEPLITTHYYYDDEWRPVREIVIYHPDPITFKTTYTYRDGLLVEKDHYGIPQGSTSEGITEASLQLMDLHLYDHPDEQTMIERDYDMLQHRLRDSVVYEYSGSLLLKESHYYANGKFHWGEEYKYDNEGHLVRMTELPDNIYTVYVYEQGRKVSEEIYDSDHQRTVKKDYLYTRAEEMDVIEEHYEGPYGKGILSRSFYKDGLLQKVIRYDPHFNWTEATVTRYTYY